MIGHVTVHVTGWNWAPPPILPASKAHEKGSSATWMLRSYFDSIPRELDEAAKVDGCSPLRSFVQIILPLATPGIVAVAIFSFLFSYNEFFISSVFLRDENRMTMPVGIQSFMQQYGTDWGSLMASATLAMVPTLILFLFVQKYLIAGATAGAVK